MHILGLGINHRTAPVELRERVSVGEAELATALADFRATSTVLESVVVSTCNRTEVYAVVSSYKAGEDFLITWLARRAGLDKTEMLRHVYVHRGAQAVTHLMEVAAGLDSMVLGETQILGQVRDAYLTAREAGTTGLMLNRLFQMAIQLGKRAQTETGIGQLPVSVSYAAVQLARKVFGSLEDKRVLVVGAGQMGALTAEHVHAHGATRMVVINRTAARAEELAARVGAKAVPWSRLRDEIARADLVISSTGASHPVISVDMVREAMERRSRPLLLIDIAVPRDIEEAARRFGNVYLYDIDDLNGVVTANQRERERQAERVRTMIAETLQDYSRWLSEQEVVPVIAAIRAKGEAIQANVMESLRHKLPELDEREWKLIQKHTMSIVNQLLRDPIRNMKDLSAYPGGSRHVEVFARLFGVTDEELAEYEKFAFVAEPESSSASDRLTFADFVQRWGESMAKVGRATPDASLHPALR
ncbi:MAG: glutamyl-tRNA reductase [Alicyclobacillus herbarius]|uniref:glutamyl-tRNA reductase n=1 Tax=Alicyclobacillus herbarius TaxID=122960 RepID=UPI0006882C5C|nr:glutamyl-tRNA reductase [Alicyclobacillus herbarius]MCL6631595.1 glutamyl-tRNA reductase [Alicyclobacillus herbarius]